MEGTCGPYWLTASAARCYLAAQESLFCDPSEGHMKHFLSCP